VTSFNISHAIVALSNLAYVFLAYWLAKKEFIYISWILVIVALVSTYYHLNPNSEKLLYLDVATALLSCLICFLHFLPYVKPSPLFVFTISLAVTATILWWESGDDRECSKYVIYHSAWHVLTAVCLFLLIKSTDFKTGKDKLDYPILSGGIKYTA
jgi:hypothetical protein